MALTLVAGLESSSCILEVVDAGARIIARHARRRVSSEDEGVGEFPIVFKIGCAVFA